MSDAGRDRTAGEATARDSIGLPRVHHRRTDSTNERARVLADAGAPHGMIVTAAEQTTGRGRHGRSWTAAPGEALLLSAILRRLESRHVLLSMAAAVAVCEAAEVATAAAAKNAGAADASAAVRCEIKWPNDVWIDGRKLSGILVEARPAADWAVVGIGVNVAVREFPPELRHTATSLALGSADELLAPLLCELERWTTAGGDDVIAAWRTRDALADAPVRWHGGEGVARGVDAAGALLVELPDGERTTLTAGEVERIRPTA